MIPHIPPKGMQTVRYAGLYAPNVKRKLVPVVHAALEALRLQPSLFDLEPLAQTFQHLKWRERKAPFGYDPLKRPRCGARLQLAETWEPRRGPRRSCGYILDKALARNPPDVFLLLSMPQIARVDLYRLDKAY